MSNHQLPDCEPVVPARCCDLWRGAELAFDLQNVEICRLRPVILVQANVRCVVFSHISALDMSRLIFCVHAGQLQRHRLSHGFDEPIHQIAMDSA